MRVIDLVTGKTRVELPSHVPNSAVSVVKVSPQGRWVVRFNLSSLTFGQVPTDDASGQVSQLLNMTGDPDNNWSVQIYNADTGEFVVSIEGRSRLADYTFSPDGNLLALAARSGLVRLVDLPGRRGLFQWQAWPRESSEHAPLRTIAFAVDGSTLVTPLPNRPTLLRLDLDKLNRELEESGLNW